MKNKNLIIGGIAILVFVGAFFVLTMANKNKTANNESTGNGTTSSVVPKTASDSANATASAMSEGAVKEFTVEGSPFKFVPNVLTVNQGDTVKIVFKNVGGMHDFVIDELGIKTKVLQSGDSETVEFIADKKGTYQFYCSVANHKAMGMTGTLAVL